MNPSLWLDDSFSLRLAQTLVHFLWQGSLVAILAFTLDCLIRRGSAQSRYLLNVVAMLAMLTCLPITFVLLGAHSESSESVALNRESERLGRTDEASNVLTANGFTEISEALIADRSIPERNQSSRQVRAETDVAEAAVLLEGGSTANSNRNVPITSANELEQVRRSLLPAIAPYITIAYLTCVLAMIVRLASGVWGGHKLRRAAVAINDIELPDRIARQAKRIGLRVAPAIAYCEQISVPVVVGIARPMILLPASLASGLSPDQLETLITHELAHLRRYDPLMNLLQRVVEAVIFFHPAVWYISRRIDVERENASDDIVLAAGWERVHYADALVRMAELSSLLRRGEPTPQAAALAASGGNQSDFKRRVIRLLDREPSNVRLTRAGWTTFLVVLVAAVITPMILQTWAQQASAGAGDENASTTPEDRQIGRRIEDFELLDYLGAEHTLSDSDSDIVVVAFIGTECPLAKLYGSRLANLAEKYKSQGVAFVGISSNQQDTPTELGHYARRHGIAFTLLKDPGNRVADLFQAERTPEVFLLDAERIVRYWGRIDDQFGIGYARAEPQTHYLTDAINEMLAGEPVSTPQTESVGCHIGRVTRVAPTGEITYAKQVSRIVQRRCVECHREDGIAPFAMQSYEEVAAWAETICEVVEDQRMPPWHASPKYGHFANDEQMPEAEKQVLYQWLENGVPKGSDEDLPPKREFIDGWALGEPDLVLTMPEPITVTATGVVDYQYVTVDPGFTEGTWVRASEIRPGVQSVVHHIIVFINPPGGDPILEERGVGFETVGGYVPGSPPMEMEEGVARYVPPGSTLVFQIHYTPDGSERHDQSQIGLYFADSKTIRHTMQTGVAANLDFEIPPNAENHRVEAAHRFSHDMELHALVPHMHYRGKAFRFEATYPNGSREILLDVPRFDFNWQNTYKLAKPKFMPEGTLLKCIAYFDNSERNLSNPDPTIPVRWGEQTWEEMMIGYFEGVFLNQNLTLPEPQLTAIGGGNYRARFTYKPDRPAKTIHLAGTFNE
ncbi:MAG: redoxin domain-containing protein [Planctomycetes bacterium]|nr:redoxin domain-containing protein [Planctomycetota bacterium]